MTATDIARDHVAESVTKTNPDGTKVPDASRADRVASYDPADFSAVTGREEDWRFTPLARLRGLHESPTFGAGLALTPRAAAEVEVAVVPATGELPVAGLPGDRPAALAHAAATDVLRVSVPAGAEVAEPSVLDLRGAGVDVAGAQRVLVTAGTHSRATLVLRFGGSATLSEHVEIVTDDDAHLTVVTVHEWADDAVHLSQHDVRIGRDATVTHIVATLGGSLVRQNTQASYAGPGGTFEAYGVYFADDGQHFEHRLFVDHAVPRCTSKVVYKGALQGETAHTVWVGDVLIRAAAEGTDTYELNRNLVLTEGARADSVPNLEIETGQIAGAGHASATGRFDDEQLFYLMARGIPESQARRMVVRAFFAEIVERIGVADVSEHLMERIDEELAVSMAGDAAIFRALDEDDEEVSA